MQLIIQTATAGSSDMHPLAQLILAQCCMAANFFDHHSNCANRASVTSAIKAKNNCAVVVAVAVCVCVGGGALLDTE